MIRDCQWKCREYCYW